MDKKIVAVMVITFLLTIFVCLAAFNTAQDFQARRGRQVRSRRIRDIMGDDPFSDNPNSEKLN